VTEAPAAIQVRGLSKTFGGPGRRRTRALDDVTLEIRRGEAFGLVGPNGAGKTTLLSCLLGFLRPDAGSITIDGKAVDDLSIRARTGYQPERLGFDRFESGSSFLAMHWRLSGGAIAAEREAVEDAAAGVGLEAGALRRKLRTYSRGMLQRIGMAQALLRRPDLLFLDEPASGIDPAGVRTIRRRILEARERGATIVVNSHQLPEVERVCDRVAFLDRGRIRSIENLRGAGSVRQARIRVRPEDTPRAREILEGAGLPAEGAENGHLRLRVESEEALAGAARLLCEAGIPLYELVSAADLEALFEEENP
jgi:ABC-2 type transport system ATP-binding protein